MVNKIEYCDEQQNPFHGCEHGCSFCYARGFGVRHGGNPKQSGYYDLAQAGMDPFAPAFSPDKLSRLDNRLNHTRKPRRIFLGSMGDLGGEWPYEHYGPDGLSHAVIPPANVREAVRMLAVEHPEHTFLILTKNPLGLAGIDWPENVHVGVSASTPDAAAERIPILLKQVHAGVRWLSLEPMLSNEFNRFCDELGTLDWVVIGAQTGPGAPDPRPYVEAAWRIRLWCLDRQVPCFVKDNLRGAGPEYPWPTELPERDR
jgi:protein gp37